MKIALYIPQEKNNRIARIFLAILNINYPQLKLYSFYTKALKVCSLLTNKPLFNTLDWEENLVIDLPIEHSYEWTRQYTCKKFVDTIINKLLKVDKQIFLQDIDKEDIILVGFESKDIPNLLNLGYKVVYVKTKFKELSFKYQKDCYTLNLAGVSNHKVREEISQFLTNL